MRLVVLTYSYPNDQTILVWLAFKWVGGVEVEVEQTYFEMASPFIAARRRSYRVRLSYYANKDEANH